MVFKSIKPRNILLKHLIKEFLEHGIGKNFLDLQVIMCRLNKMMRILHECIIGWIGI